MYRATLAVFSLSLVAFTDAELCSLDEIQASRTGFLQPRSEGGGDIFYWMWPSKNDAKTDPTVIWMQGGPGASSLLGAFYENGPCLMGENSTSLETLVANPYAWNKNATVVYVDQPMGTGFSTVGSAGYITSMDEMASDMLATILLLLEKFPQMKQNPLVLSGESYAGRYLPYLGVAIDNHNEAVDRQHSGVKIPFKTIFMNDPWTNPEKIVSTYATYAEAHGIITPADVAALDANMTRFTQAMQDKRYDDATDIEHAMEHYIEAAAGGLNAYDIRRYAGYSYDALTTVLNNARSTIGVPTSITWQVSSTEVNNALHADICRATDDLVGVLLSTGRYHVVIYNGNYDIDCNILGTLKWLVDVKWPGASQFAKATNTTGSRTTWRLPSTNGAPPAVAGYCVEVQTLSQVVVLDAGHMVPMNKPRAALALLDSVLANVNQPEAPICV